MKKRLIALLLACMPVLASCGNGEKSSEMSFTASNNAGVAYDNASYSEESFAYENDEAEQLSDNSSSDSSSAEKKQNASTDLIQREMLVYSCTMNIDVLEFEKSLEQFRTALDQYQGFVELEKYTDGGNSGKWYYEDDEKWNSYVATVRVPSRVYNDFCDSVAKLGDLRNKNASVENMNSEYYDLSTTLEIYEKKEERYLEMLSDITDDSKAIALEDKLTDIQIEIAKLKTRMKKIESDVAYSYVYVTINEVKEYKPAPKEPVKTDTFGQRLKNTISTTWKSFLIFLEELLFFIIRVLPYVVIIGLIVLVIRMIIKGIKKTAKKKKPSLPVTPTENSTNADEQKK